MKDVEKKKVNRKIINEVIVKNGKEYSISTDDVSIYKKWRKEYGKNK